MRFSTGVLVWVLVGCGSGSSNHAGQDAGDAATVDSLADAIFDGPIDAGADGPSSGIGGPPLGACTDGSGSDWCWVMPRPQGYPITAVWAASTSDVWFSTTSGSMFHSNGTSWTEVPSPGSAVQQFVGSASNDIWAVTNNETLHWDGSAWTVATGAVGGYLVQFATNDVWIVNRDTANQWNGSTWTTHPGPGFGPLAVGGDANNLIAISATGTIAKLLGTVWGVADASSHPGTHAVVIDPTHIVVIQDHDVLFWNNGTWTAHTPPVLYAPWVTLAARSLTDVWIASPGARYHWDGTSWTEATEVNPGYGFSLWQAPNGDLFTGDSDAQVKRWNGTSWTSLTDGPGVPSGVWGTANNDIFAIGISGYNGRPFAMHWDGATWTSTALQGADIVHSVNAIWGSSPNNYWIAGGDYQGSDVEQRQMLHWDGTQWTHFKLGTEDGTNSQGFRLIRAFAPNDIFAASPYKVYHYDGTSWTPFATPFTYVGDVFGSSATDLYVAGNGNMLAHWDGTAWTTRSAPISIASGVAISPTNIWLVGQNVTTSSQSELVHFDGAFFVTVTTDLCYRLAIVLHSGNLYTCEPGGIMTRPTTFGGTPTPFAAARSLWNSWFAPDGHLYVPGLMVH